MGSSAASGVICLQFSTAPWPKVNRLWDLLEKVSPVCRTCWIAMGWGAGTGCSGTCNPPFQQNCFQMCVQRAGLKPSQPTPPVHYSPGRGHVQAHTPTQPHSPRQREATPLLQSETGSEGAQHTVPDPTAHSKHKAAWAEHNTPLPHKNEPPNLPMFQINAVHEPYKLPVRSYYSNTKAEAVSYNHINGRIGFWEVCDQLGPDPSYPTNPAALGAAMAAHMERRVCQRTRSFGRQVSARHTALGKRMNSDVWRTA